MWPSCVSLTLHSQARPNQTEAQLGVWRSRGRVEGVSGGYVGARALYVLQLHMQKAGCGQSGDFHLILERHRIPMSLQNEGGVGGAGEAGGGRGIAEVNS